MMAEHMDEVEQVADAAESWEVVATKEWFSGRVMLVDGHGLVLDTAERGYAVIRIANIAAVRVADPTMTYAGGTTAIPSAVAPYASPGY